MLNIRILIHPGSLLATQRHTSWTSSKLNSTMVWTSNNTPRILPEKEEGLLAELQRISHSPRYKELQDNVKIKGNDAGLIFHHSLACSVPRLNYNEVLCSVSWSPNMLVTISQTDHHPSYSQEWWSCHYTLQTHLWEQSVATTPGNYSDNNNVYQAKPRCQQAHSKYTKPFTTTTIFLPVSLRLYHKLANFINSLQFSKMC